MSNPLGAITLVVNNSPQINTLVGGHMAATEEAKFKAQLEASQRHQELLEKTVLPAEHSARLKGADDQKPRPGQTAAEAKEKRRQAKRPKKAASKKTGGQAGSEAGACSESAFDVKQIVDVCV